MLLMPQILRHWARKGTVWGPKIADSDRTVRIQRNASDIGERIVHVLKRPVQKIWLELPPTSGLCTGYSISQNTMVRSRRSKRPGKTRYRI